MNPPKFILALFPVLVIAFGALYAAPPETSLLNENFESGVSNWNIYIPAEAQNSGCHFESTNTVAHSGTASLKMESSDFARFGVRSRLFSVNPGERYRVTAWVRADAGAEFKPETPGFLVRFTLSTEDQKDVSGGHIFIDLQGKVTRGNVPGKAGVVPKDWTRLEAVVEIPPQTARFGLDLYSWQAKGAILVDDVSLTKVDESTPLSPVVSQKARDPSKGLPIDTITSDDKAFSALDLDFPGMEQVKAALGAGDRIAARSAYLEFRRTKCPARWNVMPTDQPADAVAQEDPEGEDICKHLIHPPFGLKPSPVDVGKDFNWMYNPQSPSEPNFTNVWTELAITRMPFWKSLGDAYWKTRNEKYAAAWVAQLEDFAKKCPANQRSIGEEDTPWIPLDAGLRANDSWPYAYAHFLNSPSFTPDANWLYLRQIRDHALSLQNALLKYPYATGNHITTECFGLYTIGVLFPELREAAQWRKVAIDRLVTELDRVVPPDGMQAELTPMYHNVAIDGFWGPFQLAKLNDLPLPEIFRSKLASMFRAPVLMADQNGFSVPTNDSAEINEVQSFASRGLQLGDDPLLEWAASHGKRGTQPPDCTALPYAGFYAFRSGWKRDDMFLFFRGGPTGIGHQHEDMLEVVLKAWNQRMLPDPGSYTYDKSEWRYYAIGTPAHNTVIVDGKWQHRGNSTWPVRKPMDNPWVITPVFDYVAATYNGGYQTSVYDPTKVYMPMRWKGELDRSVSHTRRVLYLRPYYAILLDTLDGTGNHIFDAHFHIEAPAARLDDKTQAVFSQYEGDVQLGLYPLDLNNLTTEIVQGQQNPLLGWIPYGHRAIPTVRFRKKQAAPALFATLLYPCRGEIPSLKPKPMSVEGEDIWAHELTTPEEKAEVILSKSKSAKAFSANSELRGKLQANASGIVIRRPKNGNGTFVGGWDIQSYCDPKIAFNTDMPSSILFFSKGKRFLFINSGEKPATLSLSKPFTRRVRLAVSTWIEVSEDGDKPASAPPLFTMPTLPRHGVPYSEYLKAHPQTENGPSVDPIFVGAEKMAHSPGIVLVDKVAAKGKAISQFKERGTHISADISLPQAGWYRVRLRYCSDIYSVVSLLVNGKTPFAEAEEFELETTNGWSSTADNWREVIIGVEKKPSGWKIYLPAGNSKITLRNDGGAVNINWLALESDVR